ncbi:MAG: DUF1835 domain-containing protein [Gemmatimonadaceae bacterium]
MASVLHITNGSCAGDAIKASGLTGDVLTWRDILHEGRVPLLPLTELSRVRADYLATQGVSERSRLRTDFAERDETLMRFTDHDKVVLWFEWDLYDQLQLIQLLDFVSAYSDADLEETSTVLDIVCVAGYLGETAVERFPILYDGRSRVTEPMRMLGREAWRAFRMPDPREIERLIERGTDALPFLGGALVRELEEFPSTRNGLSRSESQLLQAISGRPLAFSELFKRVSQREERLFCGDVTVAGYLERMSRLPEPLVAFPSGDRIRSPRDGDDSAAFRNAQIALTEAGRAVLACERDWIEMGGSDRFLGGVHLDGRNSVWRWDPDTRRLAHKTPNG